MYPLKALGPDGYGVCFYHNYWATVGESVRKAALEFLNSCNFDASVNSTYIVLISKVFPASTMNDYRPISLCNVLIKLVPKSLPID
jgi:hypothetical protein